MKKRKVIPFWLTKQYRNTAGIERQVAEIEYYYDGQEKDILIAETRLHGNELRKKKIEIKFQYGDINEYEKDIQLAQLEPDKLQRDLAILAVDKKYQKINDYVFDIEVIKFTKIDIEKEIALIECDFKHSKISSLEREKKIASAKKEPWVKIVSIDLDKENPGVGSVELDWNQQFVDMLSENGYASPHAEQTVDLWFDELCRNIALNAYDGVGDFNEQLDLATEFKPKKQIKKRGPKK